MGKLIVFEGIDGSGKSTQAALLLKRLKAEYIDFPQYGNWSASFVEKYLRGEIAADPFQASVFFALDRFSAKEKIVSWLESGSNVISNRYVHSSIAHLGAKMEERGKFFSWIERLEFEILGLPKPDLVLLLDMPAQGGMVGKKGKREYLKGRKMDIHEADMEQQEEAAKIYKRLAENEGWVRIECFRDHMLPEEEISSKVWEAVTRVLALSGV